MSKKQLQKLVSASYKNNQLDPEMVSEIADLLSRTELKKYINALKNTEKKSSVIIRTPQVPDTKTVDLFTKIYKNKNVIFEQDSALLLGVQVINNDLVYNMNLKNRLENLENQI